MTEIDVKEIKPGILVTQVVSIEGGVHYSREYETPIFQDKSEIREWTTTARVDDIEERQEAQRVRSKIYNLVKSVCIKTPVGLICEKEKESDLRKILLQTAEEKDNFNEKSKTCRLHSYHACFEVKEDNHQTIAAILDQIANVAKDVTDSISADDKKVLEQAPRKLLKGMNPDAILLLPIEQKDSIIARIRAELIRNAIKDIKGVEKLLPQETKEETKKIINEARAIARKLCHEVERRKGSLEEVLNEVNLSGIKKSRAAFVLGSSKAEARSFAEQDISFVQPRKIVITEYATTE